MNIEDFKIVDFSYIKFLSLLEKSKVERHYIKTIKKIKDLIDTEYIVEAHCLIRMIYEELMYDFACKIKPDYSVTLRTSPKTIRRFVESNKELLFNDLFDDIYFEKTYDYLSKVTHETVIKEFLNKLLSNKDFKNVMKRSTLFVLIQMMLLLTYLIEVEEKQRNINNYQIVLSNFEIIGCYQIFGSNLSDKEIREYSDFFVDVDDRKILDNEAKDLFNEMNKLNETNIDEVLSKMWDEIVSFYEEKQM